MPANSFCWRGGQRPLDISRFCFYSCNEAIAPLGQGFNELGTLGRILQGGSELRDGDVDRVIEVAIALGWPDPSLELLALYYFPCALQEYSQYLERLVLKPDGYTCF